MNNFFNLLKIQLFTNIKINKIRVKGKGKAFGGFLPLTCYGLLFAFIFAFLGSAYVDMYSEIGMEIDFTVILVNIIAMTGLLSFFFSFYSMSNVLYNFKDYDMLISMPIKKHTIILSKLCYSYLIDLVVSLLVMIGAIYKACQLQYIETLFIVRLFIAVIFTPMFGLTLSIIIGTLFSVISSKFKRKNLIQTLLLFIFLFAYMGFYFYLSSDPTKAQQAIQKIFFIYPLLDGWMNGNLLYAIYYIATCILPLALLTLLICAFYCQLNSIMSAKKTTGKFVMKAYKGKGEIKTLFGKEIKRLFSCPIYALNTLMGAVVCLIVSVFFLIFLSTGEGVIIDIFVQIFQYFSPLIVMFIICLAPTTGCSIALEGKTFWIVKTMPIKMNNVFRAKLLVNAVFYTTVALISGVCLSVGLRYDLITSVLFTLFCIVLSLFSGILGLFANILFPHLNWENENQAVKQGMSIIITCLGAMILTALVGVAIYFLCLKNDFLTVTEFIICLLSLFTVITVTLFAVVFKKGESILLKRE